MKNRSLEHNIIDVLRKRNASVKPVAVKETVKEEIIQEEIEQLDEAKTKYHVSVNYTKGYAGTAEHAVKHYTTPRPNVSDNNIASVLVHHVREHVPQHKEMIKKGWRTAEYGMIGSHEAKFAKNEAEENHNKAVATTNILKKKYGPFSESTESDKEQEDLDGNKNKSKTLNRKMQIQRKIIDEANDDQINKNQKRFDTVKNIKNSNKKDKIVINPELDKPDANTCTTTTSV